MRVAETVASTVDLLVTSDKRGDVSNRRVMECTGGNQDMDYHLHMSMIP